MNAFPRESSASGGRPSSAVLVGAGVAVALGLLAGALWLQDRDAEDPAPAAGPPAVTEPRRARDAEAGLEAPARAQGEAASPGAAEAAPPGWDAGPAADDDRDVRGVVVRASDASPVWSATVIALQREAGTQRETESARALTDGEGRFALRFPREAGGFRVLAPPPDQPREVSSPGSDVPVRVEWPAGDSASGEVRLVLESGWRLDVRVLDGSGEPRAGVLVEGGGRSATTDADGRCRLLDLPVGKPLLTLTLHAAPGAPEQKHLVAAPEAGQLRRDIKLTMP